MVWWNSQLKETNERVDALAVSLHSEMEALRATIPREQVARLSPEDKGRLDELEMRLAKLWSMLTEETSVGRPKLGSVGRVVRGRLRR